MPQKGIVFETRLSIRECSHVFRDAGDSARNPGVRALEIAAKLAGNDDTIGYYTPQFQSPFSVIEKIPDYAVGVNILKFNAGAKGNGTHVHMYVDDRGSGRVVEIVVKCGMLDGYRSTRLTRRFFELFKKADNEIRRIDGNI